MLPGQGREVKLKIWVMGKWFLQGNDQLERVKLPFQRQNLPQNPFGCTGLNPGCAKVKDKTPSDSSTP